MKAWRLGAAFTLYAGLSAIVFGAGGVLSDPTHHFVGGGTDPSAMMWFLVWWPHALAHRLNPFITNRVWAPPGVNLAWSTSIPGLSALAAPLTARLGPVAAYNVLSMLAPALSGLSAFWLCAALIDSFWAALAGGWIYGFSAYQVAQVTAGHLSLAVTALVPLCVLLLVYRVRGAIGQRWFIPAMSALLTLQFLISNELLATMTVLGLAAMLLAAIVDPTLERRLLSLMPELAASYLGAAIVLSPYLYYMLAYPAPRGPLYPPELYSIDLLGVLLPTRLVYFHPALPGLNPRIHPFLHLPWERTAYVGLPVLAILALYGLQTPKTLAKKILLPMLALIWVAAMGPRMHILDRPRMLLPWSIFEHVPLLEHALPGRLMLFAYLVLALIVSAWLANPKPSPGLKLALVALAALVLWPAAYSSEAAAIPFFTTALHTGYLAPDELVMVIPFGEQGGSMLWQAQSRMWFRMAGGWTGPTPPEFRDWPLVKGLLSRTLVPPERYQLQAFVGRFGIQTILLIDSDKSPWEPMLRELDPAPVRAGGVTLYRVPPRLYAAYRQASAAVAEQLAMDVLVPEALAGAARYLDGGGSLRGLTMARLRAAGFVPERGESTAADRDWSPAETLFLRADGKDKLALQVRGLYPTLARLDQFYGSCDSRTHAPSPTHILPVDQAYDTEHGFLRLLFDRAGLACATRRADKATGLKPVPLEAPKKWHRL